MEVKELGDMLDNDVVASSLSILFPFFVHGHNRSRVFGPKDGPKILVGFDLAWSNKDFWPINA